MSKRVKALIERELKERFDGAESVGVINPRGIDGNKNNAMRRKLHQQNLRMVVVKNTLAKRAAESSPIKGFDSLLDGPSAVVYGEASAAVIARLLLEEKKGNEALELRGIFFDGEVYQGDAGVEQVSKMPTREEAIAQVLSTLLGPGSSLASALTGPGASLGGLLKAIEEKQGGGEGEAAA